MEEFWKALLKGLEDDMKPYGPWFWITAFGTLFLLFILVLEKL